MITITLTPGKRPLTVGHETVLVVGIEGLFRTGRDDGGTKLESVHWQEGYQCQYVIESPDEINALIQEALKEEAEERLFRRINQGARTRALISISRSLEKMVPKGKTSREACNDADERKARIAACGALDKIAAETDGQKRRQIDCLEIMRKQEKRDAKE